MRTRNYNFDIDKHSLIKPVVIIRSGDHDIDTIRVTLSEQGDPVDLTKATVKFMGTTPAGNKIIDDVHIKIVDATAGIFEYTFPSAAGASVGEYQDAYFTIVMGNGQTSTMNFRIQVLSGVDISAPAASDYVSQYNTMVANLNSAYDSATAATNTKIAAAVSSVATSASTVLNSALSNVANVNSQANNASSTANNTVSMASSVASAVTSQASYINSVASSAATDVNRALDKINNMFIGGRNLLLDTGRSFTGIGNNSNNGNFDSQGGRYYLAGGKKVSDLYNQYGSSSYLTISFDWVASGSTISGKFNVQFNDKPWQLGIGYDIKPSTTNVSGHYKQTVSLAYAGYSTSNANGIQFRQDGLQGNITISNVKLEAGNIATDWTPAPEDADNTFLKNARKLPNDALDFAIIAADTQKYQGTWYTDGTTIANGPENNWNWCTIEVLGGYGNFSGIIRTANYGPNREYVTTVNGRNMIGWKKIADDANVVHKSGDTMTGGLKGGQVNLPASGDLNTLTDTGKYYQVANFNAANWTNRPSNAPSLAFSVDVIGQANQSLVTQTYFVHTTSRMWVRTMYLNGTTMTTSPWVELANDASVVHNAGNETVAGDKTLTGNTTLTNIKSSNIKTGSVKLGGLTINFRETAVGVNVYMDGSWQGSFSMGDAYVDSGSIPTSISNPRQNIVLNIIGNAGVGGVTTNSPFKLEVLITTEGKVKYRSKNLRDNDTASRTATIVGAASTFYSLD